MYTSRVFYILRECYRRRPKILWMCIWMDFAPNIPKPKPGTLNPTSSNWNIFFSIGHLISDVIHHVILSITQFTQRISAMGMGQKRISKWKFDTRKWPNSVVPKMTDVFLQSSHSSGSPELGKSQRTASASPVQHWQGSAMNPTTLSDSETLGYKLEICVHCPIAKQCLNSLISMTCCNIC